MTKEKRILFVISYLDKGGSERALSNITLHMPKDWKIDILVNSDKVIDYPYNAGIISMGVDDKPKTGSVLFQFKILLKRLRWIGRLKKQNDYAAVISFLDSANIANILSKKTDAKTIVSVRNSLRKQASLPQYKYVVNPMVRMLYNKADSVVAVSEGVRRELNDIFKIREDKAVTIENGYDLDEIEKKSNQDLIYSSKDAGFSEDYRIIVTTGRLTNQKGQWHLLNALKIVSETISRVKLLIVGSGELEDYLRTLAEKLGIADKVIFTGYTENPFAYEKKAEVFVLPSLYEGFPNALAEAMCLGIPCIATDFKTGARELFDPYEKIEEESIEEVKFADFGVLTPVCSGIKDKAEPEEAEKKLAEAIIRLLTDRDINTHYSKMSIQRSESLDISRTIEKWVELVER